MTEPAPTSAVDASSPLRAAASAWALFAAIGLLMMGNGLLGTLLGVRSELEGFGTAVIGVVMAAYYVGFLFGAQAAPPILAQVGHIRVFAGLASLASTAALIHAVSIDPATWGFMRFVYGFCQAGLYVVAESWLNDRATNANRGRLLAMYMVVVMGGIACGQLLLGAGDAGNFRLFVLVSVLVSLAVVPMALAATAAPRVDVPRRMPLGELWRIAPLGAAGGFATGIANGALLGMGAVYGVASGMNTERIAVFMGAAMIGAVLLQWPIGAGSDHISRRQAIFFVTVAATAVPLAALFVTPTSNAMLGIMLLYGGLTFPLYSLCLAHINDLAPPGNAMGVSAAYVFYTGTGAIIGPLFAAAMLRGIGVDGFWWSLAVVQAAIGAFALYRLAVRRDLPVALQRAYAPIPARASALVALLMGRNGNDEE